MYRVRPQDRRRARCAQGLLALAAAGLLAAAPAVAQPAPGDAIDALPRAPKTVDVEEPDTAAAGNKVDPDPVLPGAPQPYAPPRPTLTSPVFLHETGRSPDAPATPTEAAYDTRLRSSAASVQGFQGPMDGSWTLSVGGRQIYAFQLVDKNGSVEGAWRDLRRPGAVDASGFFDIVQRAGGDLTFRFSDQTFAVMRPDGGRWSGQLTEAGRTEHASLVRSR